MKKLFCLFFVLILLPVFSLADQIALTDHYSLFIPKGAGRTGKDGNLFSFDSLSIDLYVSEGGESGYLCTTKCFSGLFITSGMVRVSISDQDGVLYIVDDGGNFITGCYDENGSDLWLDTEGHKFRLRRLPSFSLFEDMI